MENKGKAILFCRVSTKKQSLKKQEEELKTEAIKDGFLEEDLITISDYESGFTLEEDEREGLKKLKDYLEIYDIKTVYCREVSRISRKPKGMANVRHLKGTS